MASEGVMATNDDASLCKRYATHMKYWKDDFIQYFVRNVPPRKAPEINRGYYVRHYSITSVVEQFFSMVSRNCQIVNLGCGFDTLYWNLHQKDMLPTKGFYEIDMTQIVQKKMQYIKMRPQLHQSFKDEMKITSDQLHTQDYHLMSCDLKNIEELKSKLYGNGLDKNIPTLFIAECVFVYIEKDWVRELSTFIYQDFKVCVLYDYDPVNLNDRFGEVMKENLKGRDCLLLGAHDDMKSKMRSYRGFQDVTTRLLLGIYRNVPKAERGRIEKIEFLDEVDLLEDLLKHYSVVLCSNDPDNIGLNGIIL